MKHTRLSRPTGAALAVAIAASLSWSAIRAEAPDAPSQALAPPQWPSFPQAPAGAPNVLLVMTDDVGFGASSPFGGLIPTGAFDALAREGLRYNSFHTTAICSPTRASLLTGRNPHQVAMGNATNLPTGYEGYTSVIPDSAATVARVLRDSGYSTAMFGKGHITPDWETGPTGPFERWPTGLGFQHFFGFLNADASMYEPALVEDTRYVDAPLDDPDYHFDRDIADRAIGWIRGQKSIRPDKPVFVYYATGTAHAPHHAPAEWIERFRGRFDQGWDVARQQIFERQKATGVIPADAELTPRPRMLAAWDSLTPDQQRLGARLMEAYAASMAYADHQIGRVVDAMRQADGGENTLVIYIQGDNGASAEGGPFGLLYEQTQIDGIAEDFDYQLSRIDEIGAHTVYNTYPAGWSWAMNTPFQWYKRVASHFGGVRNGMVISWPGRIPGGGQVRSQFHHVSDVMPTILEAAGIAPPEMVDGVRQKPLDGISMAYTFEADGPSRRTGQIFEMMENMGLYEDGWMLSSTPVVVPWSLSASPKVPLQQRQWELYHVARDFSQARDLADVYPGRVERMLASYWRQAEAGNILPIHGLTEGREGMPDPARGRSELVFHPGQARIPEYAGIPALGGRSFSISARITVPEGGAAGVVAAQGGRFGGYSLYLKDGHLVFHYNALGAARHTIRSARPLPPGEHEVSAHLVVDRPVIRSAATVSLRVNGREAGRGRIERTLRRISHTEGFDVGRDAVSPVSPDYTVADSVFSGRIEEVRLHLD